MSKKTDILTSVKPGYGKMASDSYPSRAGTLGSHLRCAYGALTEHLYGELESAGYSDIRPAQRAVFRHISPEGSRTVDLARAAGLTKQSMSYLINGLERSGYVYLAPDPMDGRAKRVHLTERGEAAIQTLMNASRAFERQLESVLGKGGVERLKDSLSWIENWNA